jgi:hypothetical protein
LYSKGSVKVPKSITSVNFSLLNEIKTLLTTSISNIALTNYVVVDKTGTLTTGKKVVKMILMENYSYKFRSKELIWMKEKKNYEQFEENVNEKKSIRNLIFGNETTDWLEKDLAEEKSINIQEYDMSSRIKRNFPVV